MITAVWIKVLRPIFLICTIVVLAAYRLPFFSEKTLDASKISFDEQTYPIVILGGGMAGLTAAEYCLQANIPCLVVEGPMPGGALSQAHSIRNWPGVIDAPGANIVGDLRKHAQVNGLKMAQEQAVSVDFTKWPRLIEVQGVGDLSNRRTIKALAVIIAMGTDQKFLNIPGESGSNGYWGKGVGKCCVCEAPFCKGKHVGIVGGGNGAIREADYLAGIARKVTMFVRANALDDDIRDIRAKERVLNHPNVEIMYNAEVKKMLGDGSNLTGVMLINNKTNQQSEFPVDRLFLAIGSRPNTGIFKGQLALSAKDFIVLKDRKESSVPGIYAAGDVSDPEFVQAVTASSDGCKCALQSIMFLKNVGFDVSMLPNSMLISIDPKLDQTKAATKTETKNHKVTEIASNDEFSKFLSSTSKPIILDIFSPMCTTCQQMMPIIDQLADTFADKVIFAKINASSKTLDLDQLMSKVGGKPAETLPTFLFIKDGKEVDRLVAAHSLDDFKGKIEAAFK